MAKITDLTIDEYSVLLVALMEVIEMWDIYKNNSLVDNNFKNAEYWRSHQEIAEELLKEVENLYEQTDKEQ